MGLGKVPLRLAWPYGLQSHPLRTIAELRIVVQMASLELRDLGGELGNLREGVVDGHLSKDGTALSRRGGTSAQRMPDQQVWNAPGANWRLCVLEPLYVDDFHKNLKCFR